MAAAHAYRRPATFPLGRGKPSQRELFVFLALVLLVVLVVLIALSLGLLVGSGSVAEGSPEVMGVRALMVLDGPGTGPNPLFGRPMGVAVGRDDRIYVTDAEHDRVCVFDADGAFLFEFGSKGVAKPLPGFPKTWRPGLLNFPAGIDVDQNGDVYVADFRNDQIQVFDPDGRFLRAFPDPYVPVGKGSSGQDGGGIAVTDVAVRDGRVFATDTYQVFEFTTGGSLVGQFGKPGRSERDLDHPNGVDVTYAGQVVVADSNHSRVTAFGDDGTQLWTVGEIRRDLKDRSVGAFELPRGLSVAEDAIVVVDAFRSQATVLTLNGRVAARFGARGNAPGELDFPNDIAPMGEDFVIADKGNRRVQVVSLVGWREAVRRMSR